jgi:hypothetical protein
VWTFSRSCRLLNLCVSLHSIILIACFGPIPVTRSVMFFRTPSLTAVGCGGGSALMLSSAPLCSDGCLYCRRTCNALQKCMARCVDVRTHNAHARLYNTWARGRDEVCKKRKGKYNNTKKKGKVKQYGTHHRQRSSSLCS